MTRVSVPLREATLRYVMEHATDLGLPPGASQAKVIAHVVELGAKSLARQVRDAERERGYAEWADDPERLAMIPFYEEVARESGAF